MVRLAHGPIIEELRRHDPSLRVRWSYEKRKWCVEAKAKRLDKLTPPVFNECVSRQGDKYTPKLWAERLLPALSDRFIAFRDGFYILFWTPFLDRRIYNAVVKMDVERYASRNAFWQRFTDSVRARYAEKDKATDAAAYERSYEAYDRLRFMNRTRPWADPVGAAA